jgi:SAM-dependent methyltransferase
LIGKSKLSLNIGSSEKFVYPRTVNLDIGPYKNVDIIADGKDLPFKDDVFELVIIDNVFEHVDEPEKIIKEAYRVLKKNGRIHVVIPFVYVFHGSPDDYGRYTLHGLRKRLELAGFKIEKSGLYAGPSSTISQMLRYYLALLFSFNNDFLFSAGLNFFGWLTFPIKYFDKILIRYKKAHLMGSVVYAIGRK